MAKEPRFLLAAVIRCLYTLNINNKLHKMKNKRDYNFDLTVANLIWLKYWMFLSNVDESYCTLAISNFLDKDKYALTQNGVRALELSIMECTEFIKQSRYLGYNGGILLHKYEALKIILMQHYRDAMDLNNGFIFISTITSNT
jgi:hypothetical protein